MNVCRPGAIASLLALLALPPPAHARGESPFAFRAAVDAPVLASALAIWIAPAFFRDSLPGPACNPCDRDALNALDRPVVRYGWRGADRASDMLMIGIPVLALGGKLIDLDRGPRPFFEDLLLISESLAVAMAIQRTVSLAVRRPRPYMYRSWDPLETEERRDADANLSFFSGHTTTAFSLAASFAYTYSVRRPRSGLRPLIWLASLAVAASVGVLRVASGEHFWSDVIVGAIVGTSVGIAVPALHRRRVRGHRFHAALAPGPGGSGLALLASF